jgi:AcrR family transcriptional regulator
MKTKPVKYESIVIAAKSLFWKHGIRRVTIEEICQEAGVSKMTCYKYFSNKTAIAQYVIEEIFESGMKKYKGIFNSDIPYEEKVRQLIELKLENTHELSQELIEDIYKYKVEDLANTIESIKNRMLKEYLEDFSRAQKEGEIRSDIKPEFILYFLNHLTEMMVDDKLVGIYSNYEQMIAEVLSFFFYGIMPRKNVKK